jgi:hypothetical protein
MVSGLVSLSKTALTFSAILAFFSVPVAYAFGMTIPFMGSGLEALVDSSFITKEVYRLLLFSVGVVTYFRIIFPPMYNWIIDVHAWSAGTAFKHRVYIFYVFLAANLLFLFLVASVAFVGWSVFIGFFLSSWLLSACAFVGCTSRRKSKFPTDHGVIDFARFRALLVEPRIHYAIVSALLIFSMNLGYHRVVALAVANPVCVITSESQRKAAVVGVTERGLLVAFTSDEDWVPLTIPIGIAILDPSVFAFYSLNVVERVEALCTETDNAKLSSMM